MAGEPTPAPVPVFGANPPSCPTPASAPPASVEAYPGGRALLASALGFPVEEGTAHSAGSFLGADREGCGVPGKLRPSPNSKRSRSRLGSRRSAGSGKRTAGPSRKECWRANCEASSEYRGQHGAAGSPGTPGSGDRGREGAAQPETSPQTASGALKQSSAARVSKIGRNRPQEALTEPWRQGSRVVGRPGAGVCFGILPFGPRNLRGGTPPLGAELSCTSGRAEAGRSAREDMGAPETNFRREREERNHAITHV